MKIIVVDPEQNRYANDLSYTVVARKNVLYEGRAIQKLTYRDSGYLICKIAQVVLAALITVATLFLILCSEKEREFWRETAGRFHDQIVYQNIPVAPATTVQPPSGTLLNPVTDAALLEEKDKILQENPEYGNAVKAWENDNVSLTDQISRINDFRKYAFGTDKWVKYFGEIVGDIPQLPDNIQKILSGRDPLGGTIQNTHVLVLVPRHITMNGRQAEITPQSLGEITKNPKNGGSRTQYRQFNGGENINTLSPTHWVLMRKENLPGSIHQRYADQERIVGEYGRQTNGTYSIPSVRDAVACTLLHYVDTKAYLFDAYRLGENWTRCKESIPGNGHYILVGNCTNAGLCVQNYPNNAYRDTGVAPVRLL